MNRRNDAVVLQVFGKCFRVHNLPAPSRAAAAKAAATAGKSTTTAATKTATTGKSAAATTGETTARPAAAHNIGCHRTGSRGCAKPR